VKYFLGVDVGGTTTTISLGDEERRVIAVSEQFATRSNEGPAATLGAIVENAEKLIGEHNISLGDIHAIGLATPGPATLDGVLLKTPNLDPAKWDRFPIRAELQNEFSQRKSNVSVHYIGDGQAAALGEHSIRRGEVTWSRLPGAAEKDGLITSIFMAIVGTGLGGGATRDCRAVQGLQGRAGHVGHILLPEEAFRYEHDQQLKVGNSYCTAESVVSLTGITHQLEYRLTLDKWRDHPLHEMPGTIRDKAKQLRELASDNDELALELFDDQAKALGLAFLTVNYIGDYDLMVIGGGICALAEHVRDRYVKIAEEAYREHALNAFQDLERFEFSLCGDDAPVIGALAWVYSFQE